jgi:hypothetical protein
MTYFVFKLECMNAMFLESSKHSQSANLSGIFYSEKVGGKANEKTQS